MKVSNLLQQKDDKVLSIGAQETLLQAVTMLNEERVGALIVKEEDGGIAGIVSERDVMRHLSKARGTVARGIVADIMTPRKDLIVATPEDSLEYIMWVMSSNRVRHLPIISEGGNLVGLVSIGDVVKSRLQASENHNKMLVDYIDGEYY